MRLFMWQRMRLVIWLAKYYASVDAGEEGGNNLGPDVEFFRANDGTGKPIKGNGNWCAAFASACFVLPTKWLGLEPLTFETHRGAKRLARNFAKATHEIDINDPAHVDRLLSSPGGVIAWHSRLGPLSWKGHVGIWYKYDVDTDTLYTVEGNKRGKVRLCEYADGSWRKRLAVMGAA